MKKLFIFTTTFLTVSCLQAMENEWPIIKGTLKIKKSWTEYETMAPLLCMDELDSTVAGTEGGLFYKLPDELIMVQKQI